MAVFASDCHLREWWIAIFAGAARYGLCAAGVTGDACLGNRPAEAQIGTYDVTVKLFADGVMIATAKSAN